MVSANLRDNVLIQHEIKVQFLFLKLEKEIVVYLIQN